MLNAWRVWCLWLTGIADWWVGQQQAPAPSRHGNGAVQKGFAGMDAGGVGDPAQSTLPTGCLHARLRRDAPPQAHPTENSGEPHTSEFVLGRLSPAASRRELAPFSFWLQNFFNFP